MAANYMDEDLGPQNGVQVLQISIVLKCCSSAANIVFLLFIAFFINGAQVLQIRIII